MTVARLDHVGLLVATLEAARDAVVDAASLVAGPVEAFPSEGTREVYLDRDGRGGAARLLLLEAGATGPYARALARRGPGLHHVALVVEDARAFVAGAPARAGWLLHARSLDTWAASRTVWLARPGVGTLVEVIEGPTTGAADEPLTVEAVEVPCAGHEALLGSLACPALRPSADGAAWLHLAGRRVAARL